MTRSASAADARRGVATSAAGPAEPPTQSSVRSASRSSCAARRVEAVADARPAALDGGLVDVVEVGPRSRPRGRPARSPRPSCRRRRCRRCRISAATVRAPVLIASNGWRQTGSSRATGTGSARTALSMTTRAEPQNGQRASSGSAGGGDARRRASGRAGPAGVIRSDVHGDLERRSRRHRAAERRQPVGDGCLG